MAFIEVKLDDETYRKYREYGGGKAEPAAAKQLERFKNVDPADSILIFDADQKSALRALLGGAEGNPEAILDQIRNALTVKIGGLNVQLRQTQVKRLTDQSIRRGMDVEDVLREAIESALVHVFGG